MTTSTRGYRLNSIDFLRGLVMVIMALDHVRDFFTEVRFDPTDLSQTDSAYFFTRWITNFCAPVFVLLAGISAGLMADRKSTADLSRFLATRGLWLLVIEVTLVSYAWQFTLPWAFALQVIWVTGLSMLVMAALVWLPDMAIFSFGLVVVLGHNVLDYGLFPASGFSVPVPFWHILHAQGFSTDTGIPSLMLYPVLPWIGVMPLGFMLAGVLRLKPHKRQIALIRIGASLAAAFVILRAFNGYGDPVAWASQDSFAFTILSFLNTAKYPPSLSFLLMTLGPGLILLGLAERWRGRVVDWFVTFGRVPFFYYIAHLYLVHLLAIAAAEIQGLGWRAMAGPFWQLPEGYGISLWAVWLLWIVVVVALYPACRWFAKLKASRKDWWLSYL